MNHNCWLFPCLDKLHLMTLLILLTDQISCHSSSSKPWPLHPYIPNVSPIFNTPKHQRTMSLASLGTQCHNFLESIHCFCDTLQRVKLHEKREAEEKRPRDIMGFSEYPNGGVGSAQWYWGSWLEISSFHNFSLRFFFLHSGFTSPASECPIASKLFFSKVDMARISMSSLSLLTGMFRSWVERGLWVLPEIRADERHHTDVCHYHSRERN